jgi:hypothetical protein
MASALLRRVALAGLLITAVLWATLPPGGIAFDDECAPTGSAAISAVLFRGAFWRAQLRAAEAERDRLLALPARIEILEEQAKAVAGIEARMSRLSEAEPEDAAEKERRKMAAQSRRLERLAWMVRCQAAFEKRLGP